MAVISERRCIKYDHRGNPYECIVRIRDDAYRDLTPEEREARKQSFIRTCIRIAEGVEKRKAEEKALAKGDPATG